MKHTKNGDDSHWNKIHSYSIHDIKNWIILEIFIYFIKKVAITEMETVSAAFQGVQITQMVMLLPGWWK